MRKVFRRPSASMVVAITALVFAASGTAVAAAQLVSGDSLIKKHSLSGNRLHNHTITGKQVNLNKLGKVPSARNADHATTADAATRAGSAATAGAAPIAKLTYVESTVNVPSYYTTNGNTNYSSSSPYTGSTVTATCPTGTNVTGGGVSLADRQNTNVSDSYPDGNGAWTAHVFNYDSDTNGNGISHPANVFAICAPAAATG